MKLEQQVCSLELAKRLQELGVNAVSYFSFVNSPNGRHDKFDVMQVSPTGKKNLLANGYDVIAAFTVAELGELLPVNVNTRRHPIAARFFLCVLNESDKTWEGADTEADARAKMLAYLIENQLITLL